MSPKLRFLALGDSYTVGEGVSTTESWPFRVAHLLRGEGLALHDPRIVATTGWTTDELASGIEAADLRPPFELVSLLIGVNDQYRERGRAGYAAAFRALLERAIGFVGGDARRTLVLSIPDWGVTPFAEGRDRRRIAREIDAFNEENRTAAARRGAHYVDVTAASRRAGAAATHLVGDGLHPSAAAYAEWAAIALPAARRALAGQPPERTGPAHVR